MATISISQLDSASTMALGDLLEIAEPNAQSVSGYTSKKISIGSQLAPYIQGTVQNASLNTTNKTLVGAINEVDSEGVKWSENNVLGAKNLLKYPYYFNSQVINGITWTVNSDGTVTATGTATANSVFYLHERIEGELNDFVLPNGTYILSDGLATHSANIEIQMAIQKNGSYTSLANTRNGDVEFIASGDDFSAVQINPILACLIKSGQQNVNVTFKPMIRLASIADNTFEPFAQTNVELTAEKMAWNDYTEYGVKNLISYPWVDASGKSGRGITFEYNNEGYVTLNGTASTTSAPYFRLSDSSANAVANGSYLKIKGGKKYRFKIEKTDDRIFGIMFLRNIDGTAPSNINIFIRFDDGTEVVRTESINLSDSSVFHTSCEFVVQSSDEFYLEIDIRVSRSSGSYSPSTAKARLIVTAEEVTDLSWMPYAMSNYELTLNKMDVVNIAPIEETNNASQAYAIGDYMIWKRRFYKVTASISSGGAITEGTNVTKTTIGAELKAALNA